MPIGAIFMVYGVHLTFYNLIPGHEKFTKKIINLYKPHLKKWKKLLSLAR